MKESLRNFFIPHEGNNHLPQAVRHESLWAYGGALVVLKAALIALLFISFPSVAEFSTITQNRVTELVNVARTQAGLERVPVSPTLQQAAELKLQDMIDKGYFAHNSPEGLVPWAWFKEAGYLYTYAGENLAMNFSEAEDVHQAWMNSPTHRANILNAKYQEIGVAVGVGDIEGEPTTLVVQMFGTSFVPPVIAQKPSQPEVKGDEAAVKPVNGPELEIKTEPSITPDPIIEQPAQEIPVGEEVEIPAKPASVIAQEIPVQEPATPLPPAVYEAELPPEPTIVTQDSLTGGNQEVILDQPDQSPVVGVIFRIISKFYWFVLGFLALALFLKIVIRAHIQHKKIIIHGAMMIALGFLLLALHIHFLEKVSGPVIVF